MNDVSVMCAKPELPNMFVQWTDLHHLERLVDGGTSIVYTATYNRLPVIVKILKEDCERNELRLREIRGEIELMQSLNHPNIVQYIASGQEPRTFVVMERLEGGSLNQRLGFAPTHSGVHRNSFFTRDVRKAFSYESLLKYALQMAEALRYMHDEALPGYAVMHRDLKVRLPSLPPSLLPSLLPTTHSRTTSDMRQTGPLKSSTSAWPKPPLKKKSNGKKCE